MITHSPILAPVIALAAWSMAMLFWMLATRIPAIIKAKMKMDPNLPVGQQTSTLPARVRWKADNYNHLMEQPTIFYAVALALALLGQGDGVNATLAWCYVGTRVIHSLVQALINKIELRFAVFVVSSAVLTVLIVRAILVLLT